MKQSNRLQRRGITVVFLAAISIVYVTNALIPCPSFSRKHHRPRSLSLIKRVHQHQNLIHKERRRRYSTLRGTSLIQSIPTALQISSSSDDPLIEPRTIHKISITLPLGLTLEDMDSDDPSHGVVIVGMSPDGNAAKSNNDVFSRVVSNQQPENIVSAMCICIRDKIMSVNKTPCSDKSLDEVMGLIINSQTNEVALEVGRINESTVLNYYDGVCIAAKRNESYGFFATKCGIDVTYQCRTGNCFTCSRVLEFPDKRSSEKKGNVYQRIILNCVDKVPRGYDWLHVLDPFDERLVQ